MAGLSAWILAIEGSEAGRVAATLLALLAALLHALFGALQKGRIDPWIMRGAIDACLAGISLPVAVWLVPWPQGQMWLILAGAVVIHFAYKFGMAHAYARGAYTVVYPVVRGAAPLFTVLGAWVLFGETFTLLQWLGVLCLVGGILGLAAYNLRHVLVARETLVPALGFAVLTGFLVALYTTYDAWGIRAAPDPFTFLAWFFVLTSLDFPLIALVLWRRDGNRPRPGPILARGLLGAVIAWGSFGSVMLATRLDKVGEAAVLRETSPVFAAVIGWLLLGEAVGRSRAALMVLIAAGAVMVETGG